MNTNRILRADNKGRILLGSEYAGAFLGINVNSEGLLLQRMQMIPIETKKKAKQSKNILQYAGAWKKMPEIELDNFLKEVQTRRKATSKREKI